MIKIAALWKSKSDKVIASGYLGEAKLLLMPNNYKKDDKHPDYVLMVAEKNKEGMKPKQDDQSQPSTDFGSDSDPFK